MSDHQEQSRLVLKHQLYQIELMLAHLIPAGHALPYSFYFVDMSVELSREAMGQCYEGVWSRTTCVSSSIPPVDEDYDLQGDIFATQYKNSQFVPSV
jgi:hypothetical protein